MQVTFTVKHEGGRYTLHRNGRPYVVKLFRGQRRATFLSKTLATATARLYQFLADNGRSDEKASEPS